MTGLDSSFSADLVRAAASRSSVTSPSTSSSKRLPCRTSRDPLEAEPGQRAVHGLALRVEDLGLEHDVDDDVGPRGAPQEAGCAPGRGSGACGQPSLSARWSPPVTASIAGRGRRPHASARRTRPAPAPPRSSTTAAGSSIVAQRATSANCSAELVPVQEGHQQPQRAGELPPPAVHAAHCRRSGGTARTRGLGRPGHPEAQMSLSALSGPPSALWTTTRRFSGVSTGWSLMNVRPVSRS